MRNSAPSNTPRLKLYKPTAYRHSIKPITTRSSIDFSRASRNKVKKTSMCVGSLELRLSSDPFSRTAYIA